MSTFVRLNLQDGSVLSANILAKMVNALVVRSEDNRYLLVSRDVIVNSKDFWKAKGDI